MRKRVAGKLPGLAFGEVSKKLGELWKKCPEKDKQVGGLNLNHLVIVIYLDVEISKRKNDFCHR